MVDYYSSVSHVIDISSLPNPNSKFELLEVIGEGTYGVVYSAKNINGTLVAVKIIENVADNIEEIEEEFLTLREQCLHPNIPSFYGLYFKIGPKRDEDQLWFVMELCTGGSVTDLVQGLKKRGECLPERLIAFILKETIDVSLRECILHKKLTKLLTNCKKALCYLHRNHCVHRDVKGHNILLTENGCVKLIDFGVSAHLAHTLGKRNTSVGTPYWMAPEVIACERQIDCSYDIRCDVWSLGITAIELAEGAPPLSNMHPMRAIFHIPRNPPPRLQKSSLWSQQFNDFIAECLVKDYEQRPMCEELLIHPFIKQSPYTSHELMHELREVMKKQRSQGYPRRIPEVITKRGKLKTDRKAKAQPIFADDLASLENLNENIIVEHLFRRFQEKQIYTYIADILIAVNPFENLEIYDDLYSHLYSNRTKSENSPHIYAVADSSYHSMLHQKKNQCIVITGESGSGKTESANFLLRQLVFLGKATNRNVEEKILQINQIIEGFGNARTGINYNSSRFGKFVDVTFTTFGKVTGTKLYVYLLEQSRIVSQAVNERSFHIFYYMYDGLADEGKLDAYFLHKHSNCRSHRYLQSISADPEFVAKNVASFYNVKRSFQFLGFRSQEVESIWCILSAIIHLGDVQFEETETIHDENRCYIKNSTVIPVISKLLKIDNNNFVEALTTNTVVTKGETITKNNCIREAESTRDAMAKAIYGRLFDWIVNKINTLLAIGEDVSVGILDIFGFENFKVNSFEQLCINIANEQIQYYFNQHIFRWEQQEYVSEGISVDFISFQDNRPLLDMFLSRPLGLLTLLDEESHFPKSTDATLVQKFHRNIKSEYYVKPKSNAVSFSIMHFAGKVNYDARNFLEKNRNFVPLEVIQLLRQSSMSIVKELFASPLTKTGHLYYYNSNSNNNLNANGNKSEESNAGSGLVSQTRAQQTVSTYFRYSLMDLLHKLTNGVPHFVRCLKPNDDKKKSFFCKDKIVEQLKYTGIIETIKIRQKGFSHRIAFVEFLKRYGFLAFGFDEKVVANRDTCRLLLVRLNLDGWAIGKSKVFLRYYHVEYLSRLHEEQIEKIVCVQAFARRWLACRRAEKERWRVARQVLLTQKYAKNWLSKGRVSAQKYNLNSQLSKAENCFERNLKKKALDNLPQETKSQKAAVTIQKCKPYTLQIAN
ncbi:myosin-IIIb-like protein [Leptotrombidium deliense]|uniref:Myosin-IIIb-like protein n=1 Tax=Leptotrombidium deliense TaxID=299467 RepID=A0A443SK80_9ACAR|nr:myosin-IIIb-like protein [Leptotrombidium deliense]